MSNPFFRFKQFTIHHDRCAMKVTTDGCLFGAWVASQLAGGEDGKALDIGAGSGLLSLMVAQQGSYPIDAVELDAAAAGQAAENVAAAPWPGQVRVWQSDIQDFEPGYRYDVVFSNPPFYESELASPDAGKLVAHHGAGLTLHRLLQQVHRLLAPAGIALLLLPAKRSKEIEMLVTKQGFFIHQVVVVHPAPGKPAFRLMLRIGREPAIAPIIETRHIHESNRDYSPFFTRLLQPYYLYL